MALSHAKFAQIKNFFLGDCFYWHTMYIEGKYSLGFNCQKILSELVHATTHINKTIMYE